MRCLDLSVERWDAGALAWADAVAFSVPMHTAMRLALEGHGDRAGDPSRATRVHLWPLRAREPRPQRARQAADTVIAGEYEPGLVAWVDGGLAPGAGAGLGERPAAGFGTRHTRASA